MHARSNTRARMHAKSSCTHLCTAYYFIWLIYMGRKTSHWRFRKFWTRLHVQNFKGPHGTVGVFRIMSILTGRQPTNMQPLCVAPGAAGGLAFVCVWQKRPIFVKREWHMSKETNKSTNAQPICAPSGAAGGLAFVGVTTETCICQKRLTYVKRDPRKHWRSAHLCTAWCCWCGGFCLSVTKKTYTS